MCGNYIKLSDFGWSTYLDLQTAKTFCGTADYVSPEMVHNSQYDHKIDIWSLGVLTFELLTGNAPFTNQDVYLILENIKHFN